MKELRGNEKLKVLFEEYPEAIKIFDVLGIGITVKDKNKSLIEIALENRVPLQVILNHLSKNLHIPVKWPAIEGLGDGYRDDFGKSSKLRQGKPAGVGKILAVHSGKGGVGKTTIAIALAKYFNDQGKKVGLLDLDIDCPNITRMLGLEKRLHANKDKKIEPLDFQGIKVISMGAIQEKTNQAIMWRGPIMAKAIEQLFFDSDWGDLDILVVDFPPGTSEAPLTFFNMIKPDGALIISTPQPTALDDASKAVEMCRSLAVPILGVVENMCGEIFGLSDQKKTNQLTGAEWLGKIDLQQEIAKVDFWQRPWNKDLQDCLLAVEKLIF
jgi:Mrp family chromosome partitioning ATPase